MTFEFIHRLWLIWALPALFLLCLWGFRQRTRILAAYASERGLGAIAPPPAAFRRWIKVALLLSVLLLSILSLAGPRYGYRWKTLERRGVDLIIALDCSRSMLARDMTPSRLERAKREILDLLGKLEGDRVGLVAFAGTAFLQCPLTLDYDAFHLFLGSLSPDFLPVGGTDLAGAIETAVTAFKKGDATDKAVILITDGEATGANPLAAAKSAAEAGIKLFVIGVGETDGVPIPSAEGGFVKDRASNIVLSKLDESTLKELASVTGGKYVRSVAGDMDLDTIYQQGIRGSMAAASLGEEQTKVFENRFQWFLGLAVLLLLGELCLPMGKKSLLIIGLLLLSAPLRPAAAGPLTDALREGTAAYQAENFDASARHFTAAQLEAPENREILYNLGNAKYKGGDYEGALQAYTQALDAPDPGLKEKARYNMGNAAFKKGDLDQAIQHYEAALTLNKDDADARENLAYVKQLKENPPPKEGQQKDDKKEPGDQGQDGAQGKKDAPEKQPPPPRKHPGRK